MITIDCDYPGGNILVESINGDTVRLRQDRRDTTEWWFYWNFRIRGAAGRKITFQFTDGNVFTAAGPCFSLDGENWRWLGTECVQGDAFQHEFGLDENCYYFAMCHPYTERHLKKFLAVRPQIQVTELTRSEQGRSVELLNIPARQSSRGAVLLAARMHACEAMASYTLEGFLEFWLGETEAAHFLRDHFDLFAVPFVDKDGVENGDQGKLRAPHDHARDFRPEPHYASTRAIIKLIDERCEQWFAGLDLHCPWIRNDANEKCFLVGTWPPWQQAIDEYARVLAETHQSAVDFLATDIFPVGVDWNQGKGETLARYLRERTSARLSATVEIAYAKVRERIITPMEAITFGGDLACAVAGDLGSVQ